MGFRFKLILSYAAVIFLTLLLSTLLFGFIAQQIQQDQRREADQRLSRQARAVQGYINNLCPPRFVSCTTSLLQYRELLVQYGRFIDARILMVDERGTVQVDTNAKDKGNLEDKALDSYRLVPRDNVAHSGLITLADIDYIYYALPGPQLKLDNPNISVGRDVNTDLLLGVPQATLDASWNNFLGGTLAAGLLALSLAIAAAIFIARSVAKPLIRITRASEAIALGDYSQELPEPKKGSSKDEMGRLAVTFNRMAREVDRSQQTTRDFVANVSHELKTPLTSIQGFSQAILDGTADDRASLEHSAVVINHEAARMRRLVDELLDLSRIESGQAELNWRELDLEKLLERVLNKLEPLATAKNVSLNPQLHMYRQQPEVQAAFDNSNSSIAGPLIMGDSDRLEQIFTNILDNAIKYSPDGSEVGIKLKLGGAESGKPTIANNQAGRFYWSVVEISNNGPLIPTEQLPRIFERFYKLDKSRAKRRGESTGLGLAIARELVEAHKGMLNVSSEPLEVPTLYPDPLPSVSSNQGITTFAVALPLLALPVVNPQQLVGLS